MSFIKKIKHRMSYLPDLRPDNLFFYVAQKFLTRLLEARNITDATGRLMKPRKTKPRFVRPQKPFSKLVSVGGFGWSGSSAVVDLLSEYDGVTTSCAGISEYPSQQPVPTVPEFELARAAGGLFGLEHVFATPSFFERDAGLRIFVELVDWIYLSSKSFYGEEFLDETRAFLNKLILTRAPNGGDGFDYCHHLSGMGGRAVAHLLGTPLQSGMRDVFYLKDLTVSEYRQAAKEYLNRILSYLKSEDILVLDQATSDDSFNVEKYQDYFGPIKTIFVWRDPRDVYVENIESDIESFLPHDPCVYADWYKSNVERALAVKHPMWMTMRFEDLLFSYEREVCRIESFLELPSEAHVRPQTALVTSQSKRNVGRWKAFDDRKTMEIIHSKLPHLCFDFGC